MLHIQLFHWSFLKHRGGNIQVYFCNRSNHPKHFSKFSSNYFKTHTQDNTSGLVLKALWPKLHHKWVDVNILYKLSYLPKRGKFQTLVMMFIRVVLEALVSPKDLMLKAPSSSELERCSKVRKSPKVPTKCILHQTGYMLKNDLEITWNTDAYKWFHIYFTRMYANDFPGYQVNNFQFLCIKNRFAGWSKAFPFTPYFSVIKSSLTWSLVQNKAAHVPPSAESSWHESERPNTCSSGCIFGSLSNIAI